MKILGEFPYSRESAVDYAARWAYGRNPKYYDFEQIGGDCTNFASQCILAGSAGVMNFTPTFGWYYLDLDHRAPAWTGVVFLYNFLTGNQGPGPFGREAEMAAVLPGDLCQLKLGGEAFQHSPVVVAAGSPPSPSNILVAAHSFDAWRRPLSTYPYTQLRFLHIEGYRALREEP